MSPRSRAERALSIKRIFSKASTSDADRRLSDENEAVHAENRQLTEKVKELYAKIDLLDAEIDSLNAEIEDLKTENVLPGLIAARDFVEGLDGRTGKRQITEKLSALIVDEEERNDG